MGTNYPLLSFHKIIIITNPFPWRREHGSICM